MASNNFNTLNNALVNYEYKYDGISYNVELYESEINQSDSDYDIINKYIYVYNINDNDNEHCVNIEEKIQDISYDYCLFVKNYIKDEDLYLFENFNYISIMDFIEEIIKPDYDNWVGSEEYAERFMEIVKNKFN